MDRAWFKRVEMICRPAVAGSFYPANPPTLRRALAQLLSPLGAEKDHCIQGRGAVVPHAGYLYSGKTAGKVYRQLHIPPTVVLMGPNHIGLGAAIATLACAACFRPRSCSSPQLNWGRRKRA